MIRHRRAAALAALVLTASGLGAVSAVSAESAELREVYGQEVRWSPCDFDPEVGCATVEVPLDYADPTGKRISIAISRQAATDPAGRRGVLLANPGGPGGSGLVASGADGKSVSWPKQRFAGTPLSRYYDLIGFDPRGVGRSTPLSCEEPEVPRPLSSRPTEADFAAAVRWAEQAEAGCEKAGGVLRRHINTRDTARDMDVIRAVLREDKVNYIGYSYGTYLGAVYGSMFPRHLGRSVLDSAVHGHLDWRRTDMGSAVAAKRNVEQWADWVARRAGRFGLGASQADVLATVETVSAALPDRPERFGSQRTRFDKEMGFLSSLRPDWERLADLVRTTRDTGEFPQPTPPAGGSGTSLVTGYLPVNQTIHCETDWPADLDVYRRDVALFSEKYPYGSGASVALPDPCTFRSFTPKEEATRLERDGYPAGVVVQAEGDIQTEYSGGVEMARVLGHRLITVADDGNHGQYARRNNTCVDDVVTRYLLDGDLPGSDLTCQGQPRPDVPATN